MSTAGEGEYTQLGLVTVSILTARFMAAIIPTIQDGLAFKAWLTGVPKEPSGAPLLAADAIFILVP
jgi:hypothetical protein